MKRKNNLLYSKLFIVIFSLLITCCTSLTKAPVRGISENEIKKFCQRETIFATDVFEEFGEMIGGGDTLNGFFYNGENKLTYIFEYHEPNIEPFGEEKIDYSSIQILNIYCQKIDSSLELLWKQTIPIKP